MNRNDMNESLVKNIEDVATLKDNCVKEQNESNINLDNETIIKNKKRKYTEDVVSLNDHIESNSDIDVEMTSTLQGEGTTEYKSIHNTLEDLEDGICFVDTFEHPDDTSVYYIPENIPAAGISSELFYSQITNHCNCTQNINSKEINCILEPTKYNNSNLNGNHCTCCKSNYLLGGKLNIDHYRLPIYECNDLCACYGRNMVVNDISDTRSSKRNSITKTDIVNIKDTTNINTSIDDTTINSAEHHTTDKVYNSICNNRRVQYGPNKNLIIFKHPLINGYGVKCCRTLERGEFICEYSGEVINRNEAIKRFKHYKELNYENNYIFKLNEIVNKKDIDTLIDKSDIRKPNENFSNDGVDAIQNVDSGSVIKNEFESVFSHVDELCDHSLNSIEKIDKISEDRLSNTVFETYIDATKFSNLGRYINHSCEPNCIVIPIRVNSICPRLAIFANEDIPSNYELTYDYGHSFISNDVSTENDKQKLLKKCLCLKSKCRIYLPHLSI